MSETETGCRLGDGRGDRRFAPILGSWHPSRSRAMFRPITTRSGSPIPGLSARVLPVLFGLVMIAGGALPALAHATMIETVPADGAQLEEPPREVIVRFDEDVDLSVAPARVFDASGSRLDDGTAGYGADRSEIRVDLPPLTDGAYVVTWRAVSEDGHPIRGAFVFRVGDVDTQLSGDFVSALLGDEGDRWASLGGAILRAITYGATLIAAGSFLFSALVARGAATRRLVAIAAPVGLVGSLAQIPLFAIESTGLGLAAFGSLTALTDAVSSSLGLAALMRSYALGMLWLVARRPNVWVGYAGVLLVVVAEAFTGHTRTTEPLWVTVASDVVHVGAAAFWVGGLAALFLMLRTESDAGGLASVVARFSSLAAWSLLLLSGAGLVLAWTQVRTFAALTSTAYGWSLVAKVAVVLVVGLVAGYNRRVLVPTMVRGAPSEPSPLARLRRTTSIEAIGLAAVIAITGFLVNIEPAAQAAGVTGPFSTYVAFGDDQMNLVVDPNRVGVNEIHLYVLTPEGLPGQASGDAEIELSLPAEDIGPIVRELQVAGPGHYVHVGPELALPGEWVITVRERMSQFDIRSVEVPVTVGG